MGGLLEVATGIRGGGTSSRYGARPAPVVPPQPSVEAQRPSYKPSYTGPEAHAAVPYGQPGYQPVSTGAPRRPVAKQTGPSVNDLIWQNAQQAIGPKVLAKAANPRVAGLSDVLGALTGIPSTVNAIRSANVGPAALGVASLLPVGRLGGLVRAGADIAKVAEGSAAVRVARTAEEAAQHVTEASRTALAEGHAPPGTGGIKNAPKLKPGETTPQTGGELGAQVRSALKGAAPAQKEQAALHSAARNRQVAKGLAAREAAGGGLAGHLAERAAQKGAFPQVYFNGLRDLNQETFDEMIRHVQNLPSLKPFEQGHGVDALTKLAKDQLPAAHERAILERAFGKETSDQLVEIAKGGGFKKLGVDILNVPRSIMASADLSAPFRQGLVAGVTHPTLLARNLGPMLKMAKSEDFYQASMDAIHTDPTYPLMHKAGLALTDLGTTVEKGAAQLGLREEPRMSNLAEHMPGNNQVTKLYNRTLGTVIRGSDRAYVGFLNKLRADYFKRLVNQAAASGENLNDEKVLKQIGGFVNMATGRGNVPAFVQAHLATMNMAFFSPRLMASRVEFLFSPALYLRANPTVRKEALRAYLSMGAMAVTVLKLAQLAGAKVSTDPTNADFAKIRMGNTRIDFLGGHAQYVRLAAQLAEGKITSSTTGQTMRLGPGFAKTSRYDVIVSFLQGKSSPIPGIILDITRGQDFKHQRVTWNSLSTYQREAADHLIPFLAQDLHDLYTTSGPAGLLAGPLDLFGVGVQAYKAKPPSGGGGRSQGYGRRGGPDGSSYGRRGAGGGSAYGRRP